MTFQGNTDWAKEALGIIGGKPGRPAKVGRARKGRARRPKRIGRGDLKYVPVTAKHPLKLSRDEKIGGAVAGVAARKQLQTAAARAARLLGKVPIGTLKTGLQVGARGAAAVLGTAAIVGIGSYYLTSYLLGRKDRERVTLQVNAARAADAYRASRLKIVEDQGRPLTKSQQKSLGRFFQDQLYALGLSKADLSKLTKG